MELKEFVETKKRMCNKYICSECPMSSIYSNNQFSSCHAIVMSNPEAADEIVSKWASEHPIKTNAMKIKEVFNTDIKVVALNPDTFLVSINYDSSNGIKALKAWLESEYVEPRIER